MGEIQAVEDLPPALTGLIAALNKTAGEMQVIAKLTAEVQSALEAEIAFANWRDDGRPRTLSVPEAGRIYFDMLPAAAYDAARRGEIPTLKIGGKMRVPIVAVEQMLRSVQGKPRRPGERIPKDTSTTGQE